MTTKHPVVRKQDGSAWIDGEQVGRIERHLVPYAGHMTIVWKVYDLDGSYVTTQHSLAVAKRHMEIAAWTATLQRARAQ